MENKTSEGDEMYLEIGHIDQNLGFVIDNGWWFSYQNYVKIEFEDGTIKTFKTKDGCPLISDKKTYRELVEFIDNYASNGFELPAETTVVLDEDDVFVV